MPKSEDVFLVFTAWGTLSLASSEWRSGTLLSDLGAQGPQKSSLDGPRRPGGQALDSVCECVLCALWGAGLSSHSGQPCPGWEEGQRAPLFCRRGQRRAGGRAAESLWVTYWKCPAPRCGWGMSPRSQGDGGCRRLSESELVATPQGRE